MKKLLLFSTVLLFGFAACSAGRASGQQSSRTDEGVVIDGVRWATRNVDAPGTFARNPEDTGMFFQWNRRRGWAAAGDVTGWDSSLPTGTEWAAQNDPCPPGWRVPTRTEVIALRDAGTVLTTQNGVVGRLFGTAPNQIFLPAAGWRTGSDGTLTSAGAVGEYWTTLQYGSTYAWGMFFNKGGSMSVGIFNNRAHAMSVRCVAR